MSQYLEHDTYNRCKYWAISIEENHKFIGKIVEFPDDCVQII